MYPDLGFSLNTILYPNNSVVAPASGDTALYCLTDNSSCCRGADGTSAGEWFLPGETQPVVDVSSSSGSKNFTRDRVPSAVVLFRNGVMWNTGIYTCQIPDQSGESRRIYIGVNTGTQCHITYPIT